MERHGGKIGNGATARMEDMWEVSKRALPRSACKVGNGLMFKTAANPISSIFSFGSYSPYLFVKQMCQIGNMEGFVLVENYMCAAV